jgi:hypothetical protein
VTRRPRVPGLSDEWAKHQMDLLEQVAANPAQAYATASTERLTPELLEAARDAVLAAPYEPSGPCCRSCTVAPGYKGPGTAWDCDPDRPGCPLHNVPEKTRSVDVHGCPGARHHGVDCPGDACRYAA